MNSICLRHSSVVRSVVVRMSSTNFSYEEAIKKLNSLQSNKSTIEQIKKGLKTGQKCTNLEDMENYLKRVGISLNSLDKLSVIHVAGTKGKGSTSAMCECVLRGHGYRTGFYSSPHLVAARERIRLDGRPLPRQHFADTLHHVYNMLYNTQEYEGDMPKYFAFLTVCAFYEFLRQRVDVAVVEVGIGGIVDYTNVLRKVPVVGITALGLDHTSILGDTLPQIAAAKAGVMKRGCVAYTVRQPPEALAVLQDTARRLQCPLSVVPDYESYTFMAGPPRLPVDLDAYRTNASLAIQLAHAWMRVTQSDRRQHNIPRDIVIEKSNDTWNHVNNVQNGQRLQDNDHNGVINGVAKETEKKLHYNGNAYREKNGIISNYGSIGQEFVNKLQNGVTNGHSHKNKDKVNVETVQSSFLKDSHVNSQTDGSYSKKVENVIQCDMLAHKVNGISTNYISKTQTDIDNAVNGAANKEFVNGSTLVENVIKNGNILKTNKLEKLSTFDDIKSEVLLEVPGATAQGLSECVWPGRYQVIETKFAKFYLDGAHTRESMEICARWFLDTAGAGDKCLIFTATGDRNAATLLQPLTTIPFTHIYFAAPTAERSARASQDNYSAVEQRELAARCRDHAAIWRQAAGNTHVAVLESVTEALHAIQARGGAPSVLITGSLHLVGAALSILDPSLSS